MDSIDDITFRVVNACRYHHYHDQGPCFDDMSSFFPSGIDDVIQYINLEYGAQAPKIVIL